MSNEQIIQLVLAGIPISILFALKRKESAAELLFRIGLVVGFDLFIVGIILVVQRMR